jgi:hypothetical protein
MEINRLALIFDDANRPETTGTYCRRALESLLHVEHFRPWELARIPPTDFDLYLNIDDGLRYRLPTHLRPCAWWAIDTHMDLSWYQTKAPDFDVVFTAQRNGARQLAAEGIARALWLPLACDPQIHRKHDVAKQYDVCFIGSIMPGARTELLELIHRHYRSVFIGQRYFDEMARTYSASRLVFNRSVADDLNMRVFEALACGSLLITNVPERRALGYLSRPGRLDRQDRVLSGTCRGAGADRGGRPRGGDFEA